MRLEVPGARLYAREFGDRSRRPVILLHGGPGLPGYMGVLAKALERDAFVLDYHQRGAPKSPSAGPFRVADHVRDLDRLVDRYGAAGRPILIGHSWGAVLALSYAAAKPGKIEKAILVGCGPLEPACSARFSATIGARLSYPEFLKSEKLKGQVFSKTLPAAARSARYREWCGILLRVYNRDPDSFDLSTLARPDVVSALATNADYTRMKKTGALLKSLRRISDRLVVFHGDYDPIPWQGIIPHFKKKGSKVRTVLLRGMGHLPWLERDGSRFVRQLRREILS